jgi:hypothetical protein
MPRLKDANKPVLEVLNLDLSYHIQYSTGYKGATVLTHSYPCPAPNRNG